ncbi:methyltransferase [Streptomyces sp. NPDC002004]
MKASTDMTIDTPVLLPEGVDGALWERRFRSGMVRFRGVPLRIDVADDEDVLFPSDCGLSLLTALEDTSTVRFTGRRVLDIGCGSGLYTVAALADGAAHVTALDINAEALDATSRNVRTNGLPVDRLECLGTGLADYRPLRGFDVIVTNPPHLPADSAYSTEHGLKQALIGGDDGRQLYDMVIDRVADLLTEDGVLVVAHSSLANVPRTVSRMAELGFVDRTLSVVEMDIPLRAYGDHATVVLERLAELRREQRAAFSERRFFVHVLAFSRA